MANFDTASKRFSGMQMGEEPATTLPVPDGTIAAGDRLHLLSLYSGIAAAAPGGAKPWLYRNHTFTMGVGFVRASL